jgi:glyoxylase-like metal-dependent hydrolase (beta-lactamase superfamily II)
MENDVFRFSMGDLNFAVIRDFTRMREVRELIANPKAEIPVEVPSGEEAGDYNCLLVETRGHRVLFDAGLGSRMDGAQGKLVENLGSMGLGPGDIDRLVITHADGDHIGGILDEDGEPVFPKARYVLWQGAWDYWSSAAATGDWPQDRVDFNRDTYAAIEDRLDLVEAGVEFLPGLRLEQAVGHKADHVAVRMESGGESLLHIADGAVHPLFLDFPDLYAVYDLDPAEALACKRRLLDWSAAEGALVFAPHFPFPALGRVRKAGKGWEWLPAGR